MKHLLVALLLASLMSATLLGHMKNRQDEKSCESDSSKSDKRRDFCQLAKDLKKQIADIEKAREEYLKKNAADKEKLGCDLVNLEKKLVELDKAKEDYICKIMKEIEDLQEKIKHFEMLCNKKHHGHYKKMIGATRNLTGDNNDHSKEDCSENNNKACKKAGELKDQLAKKLQEKEDYLKKYNADRACLVEQIAQIKKQIEDLCNARDAYIVKSENELKKLNEDLARADKACNRPRGYHKGIGASRKLYDTKNNSEDNSEDNSEECSEDSGSDSKSYNNHGHSHDNHGHSHNNHGHSHNNHGHDHDDNRGGSAWGSNSMTKSNVAAATEGKAYGKGASQSMAGPQGAQSQAKGEKGTSTTSNFNSNDYGAFDNWGVSSGKGKSDSWGNKGIVSQNVAAKAAGKTYGEGESGTMTGREGSKAFGSGTEGSSSGASWNGNSDSILNGWGISSHK